MCLYKIESWKVTIKSAMIAEDKIIEIFYIMQFFENMTAKYTLKSAGKRKCHLSCTMSKIEIILVMILFHDPSYHRLKYL
jgi:hypothetical protein